MTSLLAAPGSASSPPGTPGETTEGACPRTLYITLGPTGEFKVGTCPHCVISERERPSRAWSADGDRDLDFARDTLFAELAALGIQIVERQAYVCP